MKFFTIWKNRLLKFLDNPRAVGPFLKKRLYYDFIADTYLPYYRGFTFLDYESTLNICIEQEKSLVRFGDELFDMLQGIGLYFDNWHQRYSSSLAKRLEEILSSTDDRLLLAFNPEFIFKSKQEFKKEGIPEQYTFWTNSKIFLKKYLHKEIVYGSALCFHPRYNTAINYKKLGTFFAKKHIIIVTSNTKRFEGMLLGKTTHFIESPASDAWQQYERIHSEVIEEIKKIGVDSREILVMTSMGSAAKVLVFDLTKEGYLAWDTGQFFDLAAAHIT